MSAPDTMVQIAINAATPDHIRCSLQEAFTIAYVLRKSRMTSVATFGRNEPSDGSRSLMAYCATDFGHAMSSIARRSAQSAARYVVAWRPLSRAHRYPWMMALLAEMETSFMSFLWPRSIFLVASRFPALRHRGTRRARTAQGPAVGDGAVYFVV